MILAIVLIPFAIAGTVYFWLRNAPIGHEDATGYHAGPRQQIVCAWCKQPQGTKPCSPNCEHLITHTICPACKVEVLKGLNK
jgi:hypothetical protein